jgi:hypothetical protein
LVPTQSLGHSHIQRSKHLVNPSRYRFDLDRPKEGSGEKWDVRAFREYINIRNHPLEGRTWNSASETLRMMKWHIRVSLHTLPRFLGRVSDYLVVLC